jgi:integrase
VRDTLYFLLLMYGGLRKSEPLHIFLQDIEPDPEQPGSALVFLYHPESGPVHGERCRRTEYLRARYQLVPRNRLAVTDQLFAGWKSILLDEQTRLTGPRTRVYWRNPEAGCLFWQLHRVYMTLARPKRTSHPYYFVSLSGSGEGRPMTVDAVDDSFARALSRMDLSPDASAGLAPHCMRHLYAQELVDAGLDPAVIQMCLHHLSVASQIVYTRPTPGRLAEILAKAAEKIDRAQLDFDASSLGIRWKSDPLGIFATSRLEDILKS